MGPALSTASVFQEGAEICWVPMFPQWVCLFKFSFHYFLPFFTVCMFLWFSVSLEAFCCDDIDFS